MSKHGDLGKNLKQIHLGRISTSGWDHDNNYVVGKPGDMVVVSNDPNSPKFVLSGSPSTSGSGYFYQTTVTGTNLSLADNTTGISGIFERGHGIEKGVDLYFKSISGAGNVCVTGTSGVVIVSGVQKQSAANLTGYNVGIDSTCTGITGILERIDLDSDGEQNNFIFKSLSGAGDVVVTGNAHEATGVIVISGNRSLPITGYNIGLDNTTTGASGILHRVENSSNFLLRSLSGAGSVTVTGLDHDPEHTGVLVISGSPVAAAAGGGGAGAGYTGTHDYGQIPAESGGGSRPDAGPFTGDLTNNFCNLVATGNITGFTFSGLGSGFTSIIRVFSTSGNAVYWDTGINWIGGPPGAFESGKFGTLTVTCYDTGVDGYGNLSGQVFAGYASED